MLMCVSMHKKEFFDRMWKFSMEFMYMKEGFFKGYFAWCNAKQKMGKILF
jgi:oligosaccharide reducing-end xylanase